MTTPPTPDYAAEYAASRARIRAMAEPLSTAEAATIVRPVRRGRSRTCAPT